MRDRLLVSLLGLTLLTVLLYGVPRAFVRAGLVHDEAQTQVAVLAQAAADQVDTRLRVGLPVEGTPVTTFDAGDSVVYRDAAHTVLLAGGAPQPHPAVRTTRALFKGTVEVTRTRAAVRAEVRRELTPIAATGALALLVAAGVALLLARRLARPFQALAEHAGRLGAGSEGDLVLPGRPLREAETVRDALRTSGLRLEAAQRQERAFARNVAHQLRTPLTGIRLRVEDVVLTGGLPDQADQELTAVLVEVDRLADSIALLLSLSRREDLGAVEEVSLDALLRATADRWQPVAAQRSRALVTEPAGPLRGVVPTGTVGQVLDVLVDNALRHGTGTVRLRAEEREGCPVLVVTDEGTGLVDRTDAEVFAPRPREHGSPDGEGLGLGLCAQLAELVGGRLELTSRTPTAFALRLPA